MNKRLFGFFLLAGLLLPAALRADDVSPAWEFTTVGNYANSTSNLSFGEVFLVNQDITIDYLGYYYDPSIGMQMQGSHPVVMYDAYGNPLASTIITNDSLPNSSPHFIYNPITPITLLAGNVYVLDGATEGIDPYAWNDPGFSVYAPITILGGNVIPSGLSADFSGLNLTYTSFDGLWGADFGYEEPPPPPNTPEPSSILLLGSGLAGLAGLIKRKLAA